MNRAVIRQFLIVLSVLLLPGVPALAAESSQTKAPAETQTIPGLGTLTFQTSTHSPQAQTAFIRGLLLLHVFEYPDAAKAFQSAETIDPTFAMAYWGEAMTHNHPVWNELDVPAGAAALRKLGPSPQARAAAIADPRQRAYLAAVEILYSGKGTKPERDAQYAEAMERLAKAYPADDEAQLFYSLALLGRSEGVRDVPVYLQAAAIAKAVYERNPNHPGAAHYWIHGMDDPVHASGALVAARSLSKIAPAAAHAQHMCSHIFMALGMWNDVVDANLKAVQVSDEERRSAGLPVVTCGHYVEWLEYGYYQQGRIQDGNKLLTACQSTGTEALAWMGTHKTVSTPKQLVARDNTSLVRMRGVAVIDARQWTGGAVAMAPNPGLPKPEEGWEAFTTGYAAAERGDLTAAADSLKRLRVIEQSYAIIPDAEKETAEYLNILGDDLDGLIASKNGDLQGAIARVQRAAATYDAMAFDFGPPPILKPPQELLGELLLHDGKPELARAAFQASLKRAPNRTQSLIGLARAQHAAGNNAGSVATYKQLLAIWKNADANPNVAEAEHYVSNEKSNQTGNN